jgi:hypothetical protein
MREAIQEPSNLIFNARHKLFGVHTKGGELFDWHAEAISYVVHNPSDLNEQVARDFETTVGLEETGS